MTEGRAEDMPFTPAQVAQAFGLAQEYFLQSYAPLGVAGDVLAIVERISSTLALTGEDLLALGEGLCTAMSESPAQITCPSLKRDRRDDI